jgi:tetratricopeptide (TPR) repeat protein
MNIDQLGALLNRAVAHHQSNELKEAAQMYQQILTFMPNTSKRELIIESNDDIDFFDLMSKTSNNFALLLKDIGQFADGSDQYQQAIILMEAIRSWCDDSGQEWPINYQNDLAGAHINRAVSLKNMGALDEAKDQFQQAILLRKGIRNWCIRNEQEWTISHQNDLANAYINIANLLDDMGLLDDAKGQYQQAILLRESIRSRCDDNEQQWPIAYQNDLACAYLNFAILLKGASAFDNAKDQYQQAIYLSEGIRTWCDDNEQQWPISYQNDLASAYLNFVPLLIDTCAFDDAKEKCQKAIFLMEAIRRWCDGNGQQWPIVYQNNLAGAYINLAISFKATGEWNYSCGQFKQAIILMEAIQKWCDDNGQEWPVNYQNNLATAYINLADLLSNTGNFDDAKEQYQQAIHVREDIRAWCDANGQEWTITHQNDLAGTYSGFAIILRDTGALYGGKDKFQHAILLREDIRIWCNDNAQQWPIAYQNDLACAYLNFAILLKDIDALYDSKNQYQQAIFLMEDIRIFCEDSKQQWPVVYQDVLAVAYMNMAILLKELGAVNEAKDQYQQAIQLYDDIFSQQAPVTNRLPLDIRENKLIVWLNYFSVVNVRVTERFLGLTNDAITLLGMYTSLRSQTVAFQLLHRMVAFSLKHNEINLAVKLIHCVQGRELAYKLEASNLTGDEPEVVALFVEQREHYRKLLAELTQNPKRENDKTFLAELSVAKDAYSQSRASVASLPEYAPLLSPLNIEITDIQATQTQGQATLMWLSFTDDKEFPVNGVLAIPAKGEPQYFDLTDSLGRLLTLHDDLAKLMSGRGYRKNAMDYSEADIQAVIERYTKDGDVKTPEFVIKQVWHNITRNMREIWQGDNSELGHWLTHHGIDKVLNLTQGKTHNFPLALGSAETIKHRFIPGLALWRQRQALNLGQENTSNNHCAISSQICIGKAIASEHEDTSLLIPHTVLEQQALLTQFSDANHNNSNVPSNTSQAISLTTQDTQTAQNVFPHHDKPLGFVHIACHGVPDKDKAGGAKLMLGENSITSDSFERMKNTVDVAFFNACIAGTTQDDTKGEHIGLLIPLLTKAHQVIAATLPLDDVKASYFAVLLFHYYWREAKPLTESVTLAKADLQTGLWPTQVKDSVINIYHQAVDELPKDYLEYVIRRLYPPIPELCYCLQIFDLDSLDIDHAYPVVQANMKVLITQQFEQGLTAHLQDSDEGDMAQELLTVFVSSIKVFG